MVIFLYILETFINFTLIEFLALAVNFYDLIKIFSVKFLMACTSFHAFCIRLRLILMQLLVARLLITDACLFMLMHRSNNKIYHLKTRCCISTSIVAITRLVIGNILYWLVFRILNIGPVSKIHKLLHT